MELGSELTPPLGMRSIYGAGGRVLGRVGALSDSPHTCSMSFGCLPSFICTIVILDDWVRYQFKERAFSIPLL